jgi:DNA-binding NarL/FixJ family response regulator
MILESADDVAVVGEAGDGDEAIAAVNRWSPDVVVMDIRMPRLDGIATTAALRANGNTARVLILTTFDIDDHVVDALAAGADGFVLKDTPPHDLLEAVRVVADGDSMLSPSIARMLIDHVARNNSRARTPPPDLTAISAREREVLVEIAAGRSNAEIGTTLFMSEATVKAHVTRLLTKLDRTNRVQLAILAHRAGLS